MSRPPAPCYSENEWTRESCTPPDPVRNSKALNRDFRYHLTGLGAPGLNLYVAAEVPGNRFKIAGRGSGAKVSWQVTGIRQDA